jgi:hypothetical protein
LSKLKAANDLNSGGQRLSTLQPIGLGIHPGAFLLDHLNAVSLVTGLWSPAVPSPTQAAEIIVTVDGDDGTVFRPADYLQTLEPFGPQAILSADFNLMMTQGVNHGSANMIATAVTHDGCNIVMADTAASHSGSGMTGQLQCAVILIIYGCCSHGGPPYDGCASIIQNYLLRTVTWLTNNFKNAVKTVSFNRCLG